MIYLQFFKSSMKEMPLDLLSPADDTEIKHLPSLKWMPTEF